MAVIPDGSAFSPSDAVNPLTLQKGNLFRYTIYFNLDDSQTLYQSPVLDDITFTFMTSKPKVLLWQIVQ